MSEAVAGAAVGAAIDVLLKNLLSFPVEEISLNWNFNKVVEKLNQSAVMIRDFLEDAEMKQVTDKPVKRWLQKLQVVAFDADYIFDELNYQILRKKVETDYKMKKQVRSFFSTSNPIAFRHRMTKKINNIKNELKSINQEASQLGLQMRFAGAHARGARVEVLTYIETDSFTVDRVFVGRENDVMKLVEMVNNSPTEQVISVLAIVGMGGLGKTTLARKVFNDSTIICDFRRIWVHVPENFNAMMVLNSVVASVTGENVDGSREVVLQKLQKCLGDKRFLLVLDNVWNEDIEKWDNFITSLEGICQVKGNVIIVTTRKINVASNVKTLDVHKLGVISEEDCWFIIKSKAFRGEDILLEFETIGKHIAKRCAGLPLAAKVVGSLLRGKSKDEWLSVEKKWLLGFGGDGDSVSEVLKLSFDNLPSSSLKKCFAYCSIFPKGSWMRREELIELWMAEGLIQTDQENDMESVGNNVFNLLVQSSLLQVWKRDRYGINVESCGMHDLVHDLALSALNPKFWDDIHQVRYIFPKSLENESSFIREEQAKYLRTLFFNDEVSNIMFSKFTCLHVLILHNKNIKELPVLIGRVIHLRLLDISHTRIECLPDSIGELYHLQTLRATARYFRKLPYTLKYLISLRHLHIPSYIELPPEIGTLTSLQTLVYFKVSDEKGCGIMELGKLKNLNGELEIYNLGKVRDKEEAKSADLFHKPNIFKLKLAWHWSEGEINHENVLEGLEPHPNLKILEINGFNSRSFPLWASRMEVRGDLNSYWVKLDNLVEIKLSSCKECEEIPMLGHLPHLKSLYLHDLTNVKSMGSSFYGIEQNEVCKETQTIIVFPSLERLELKGMENLREWEEVELPSSFET